MIGALLGWVLSVTERALGMKGKEPALYVELSDIKWQIEENELQN